MDNTSNMYASSVFTPLKCTGRSVGVQVGVCGGDGVAVSGVVMGTVCGRGYAWWKWLESWLAQLARWLVCSVLASFMASACVSACTVILSLGLKSGVVNGMVVTASLMSLVYLCAVGTVITCLSLVLGESCVVFGISYFVTFLTLHGVVARRATFQHSMMHVGSVGSWYSAVLLYSLSFIGLVSGSENIYRMVLSVFTGVLAAWLGYPCVLGRIYREKGEFTVVVAVVLHSLLSLYGLFGILMSRIILWYMWGRNNFVREEHGKVEVEGGTGSQVSSDLCRVMSLDMLRLHEVMSEDVLNLVGTGNQGVHEKEDVRRLALLGDRVMSLAIADRAAREGWSVANASDVSQALITNAALSEWYGKKLVAIYPCLQGRAEKRKGTLVECLVGIAYRTGSGLADIEAFVFNNVSGALGRKYDRNGECIHLL